MTTTAPINLFGGSAGSTSTSSSGNSVQFRAGKMHKQGTTVTADPRKGTLSFRPGDDGLLHMTWRERTKDTPEDDLMLFPDDAVWERVSQCTTGRVYVLKFKSSSQRVFFWMQEPKTDKDDEFATKINSLISNPNVGTPLPSETAADNVWTGSSSSNNNAAASMPDLTPEQEQLMRLLTGGGLGNISAQPNASATSTRSRATATDLNQYLTPKNLKPVIDNAELRRRLFPFMPEGHDHTEQELVSVINSAPFRQAVDSLGTALQSGDVVPLLQQLGLDVAAINSSPDRVLAFLQALQRRQQQQHQSDQMDEGQ